MKEPACREPEYDPDWWFSENWYLTKRAREICGTCPLREPCLMMAVRNEEREGVWGGLHFGRHSEDRKLIIKMRKELK